MDIPDYSKYSISELYDALQHIDEESYPERVQIIKQEIDKKHGNSEKKKLSDEEYQSIIEKKELYLAIMKISKTHKPLKIITLVFGIMFFLTFFMNLSIPPFGYQLNYSFPGVASIDESLFSTIAQFLIFGVNLCFVLGGLSFIKDHNILREFLLFGWAILSFGFQIWQFSWYPSFYGNLSLSFNITLLVELGVKLNFIPFLFFIWVLLINPEYRKRILDNIYPKNQSHGVS